MLQRGLNNRSRIIVSFVIIENIRRRIGNIVCGIWALGQCIDYINVSLIEKVRVLMFL